MTTGSLRDLGVRPWRSSRRYIESIYHTLPRYWSEVKEIRSATDLYLFVYYKFPHLFPLISFPPKITLEITNHCDLACPQCHRGHQQPVAILRVHRSGGVQEDHR